MSGPDDRERRAGDADGSAGDPRDRTAEGAGGNAQSAVTIERPDVSEIDALVDLWVALASDQRSHDSHILPEENRATVRDVLARHAVTGGIQVARHDDEIVGFVTFGPEPGDYEQDATRGVVHNVYVRPDHRGRGIGSDLLEVAESALRSNGATVVSLEVLEANDRARAFYRDRGYAPHRIQLEKELGVDADAGGETDDGDDNPEASRNQPVGENDTHSKED